MDHLGLIYFGVSGGQFSFFTSETKLGPIIICDNCPKKVSHWDWEWMPMNFAQKGGDHAVFAALCRYLFWPTQLLEMCRWYGDTGVWHSGPPGRKVGICCLWSPVTWNYRLNQVLPISFTLLRLPVSIWHPPLHTSHILTLCLFLLDIPL